MPRPLLQLATNALINRERNGGSGEYVPLHELIPAMRYDFNVVAGMSYKMQMFASVKTPILLLGGTDSPAYLKAALGGLHTILAKSERVEFEGLDHSGSWNTDKGGRLKIVAQALGRFFKVAHPADATDAAPIRP